MADVFDAEKRSWVMSRIKGRDTRPEVAVRSLLHRLGYRFTVNGPRNRRLPGKPDIVLPRYGTVVFVHGCFWHGHRDCPHFRLPKTRTDWWRAKIEGNRERDRRQLAALESLGWRVVVLWTCEFNTVPKFAALEARLPGLLDPGEARSGVPRAAEEPSPYGAKCRRRGR